MFPFPYATPFPQFWGPAVTAPMVVGQSFTGSASSLGQPSSASSLGQVAEDDVMTILSTKEAMEFTLQ